MGRLERAHRIKSRVREVTVPSGASYVIGPVDNTALVERGVLALLAAVEGDPEQLTPEDAAKTMPAVRALVALSLRDPSVWEGDPTECPADHVTFADIGADVWPLAAEVKKFLNMTEEAAAHAASFRTEVRGASGQDSTEVSGPAHGDSTPEPVREDPAVSDIPAGSEG